MPESHSQTVERAIRILNCFSVDAPEWSLKRLGEATGLTIPTAHRLCQTLVAGGFLRQSPSSKGYSVGPAVMKLAGAFSRTNDVLETIRARMEQIRDSSGETVALHWLVQHERIRVASMESQQAIRIASPVGQANPLHRGAAGKVLLSYLPQQERLSYLKEASESGNLQASVEQMNAELTECREMEYATSFGEVVSGVSSLAVAIRSTNDYPVAAISVGGPDGRWTLERMIETLPQLKAAATEAESVLSVE